MKTINITDISYVSGAGAESYRMAVSLEFAQAMAAKFNNCNVKDLTEAMFKSAVVSGALGSLTGGVMVPGIGMVPGWVAGAVTGAGSGAINYGLTCWW